MKPVRSKKDIQADLEKEVAAYLNCGGDIHQIERGETGLDRNKPWINPFAQGESEKPATRTPVPDVVAAIDARKKPQKPKPAKRRKPEKVWIYDDFGEPVRWVWADQK